MSTLKGAAGAACSINEYSIMKEEARKIITNRREEKFPELSNTWFITIEPVLNSVHIFERLDIIKNWHENFDNDEQFESVMKNSIEVHNQAIKYFVMTDHTMKYLSFMSPHILKLFQSTHFNVEGDLIPYTKKLQEAKVHETFWFGSFIRNFCTDDKIQNSLTVLSVANNLCLNISADGLVIFRNNADYSGTRVDHDSPECYNCHKSHIDFSTYNTFIKSLNVLCRKIKLSELDPSIYYYDPMYSSKRYSDDRIRWIVHSENFFDIENVYYEIIKRGYDK